MHRTYNVNYTFSSHTTPNAHTIPNASDTKDLGIALNVRRSAEDNVVSAAIKARRLLKRSFVTLTHSILLLLYKM